MPQPPTTTEQQIPASAPHQDQSLDGAGKIVLWIALWYFFGPAPWRGYTLRKKLAESGNIWHAQRRWDQHTSVALAWPLLCWAILAYLRVPVAVIWGAIFATIAGWIHLPAFVLLGSATLLPPTPGNLLFRWLICAPLTPLIAHVLELLQPQTPYTAERVVTPEDQQAHQAIEQEEEAEQRAIELAKKEKCEQQKAIKAARTPRTSQKPPVAETAGPHIPHPTSLWGSVDWSQVDDNDLAKQLMLAELNKLSPSQLADVRRTQRTAQTPSVTSAPGSASSTPVSSEVPTQKAQNSDEYDWSAGDGSVSF
jgi:hypothetical protein